MNLTNGTYLVAMVSETRLFSFRAPSMRKVISTTFKQCIMNASWTLCQDNKFNGCRVIRVHKSCCSYLTLWQNEIYPWVNPSAWCCVFIFHHDTPTLCQWVSLSAPRVRMSTAPQDTSLCHVDKRTFESKQYVLALKIQHINCSRSGKISLLSGGIVL